MSELQQLRDRLEVLEMVVGLKMPLQHDLASRELLRAVGCKPGAARVIGMLLKRDLVSRDGTAIALGFQEPRSAQLVETYIVWVRKALRPHGIEIENVYGQGWRLTEPNKRKLRALLDQIAAQDCA